MVANSWAGSAKACAGGIVQALSDTTSEVAGRAKAFGHVAATSAHSKASELGANAKALALNRATQATSAGAAGGAIAMGAAGGGLGLVTGGAAGIAVGLVPALFTFVFPFQSVLPSAVVQELALEQSQAVPQGL